MRAKMSQTEKLVIIGCAGLGGPAAMMAKKLDPSLDVTLIREEENFLTRCAVPYIAVGDATLEASVKDDAMASTGRLKLLPPRMGMSTPTTSLSWLQEAWPRRPRFRVRISKAFSRCVLVGMPSTFTSGYRKGR